jgi:hypothetical protein
VSCAGMVRVMTLAEQAGLSGLVAEHVVISDPPIASTGANPAGKVSAVVAGGYSIDDPGVHPRPHRQLAGVARRCLVALARRAPILAGATEVTYVDIDSLLRRVYGKHQQGVKIQRIRCDPYSIPHSTICTSCDEA